MPGASRWLLMAHPEKSVEMSLDAADTSVRATQASERTGRESRHVSSVRLSNDAEQFVAAGGEVIDGRAHYAIGQRLIEIAHRAGHLGVRSGDQL